MNSITQPFCVSASVKIPRHVDIFVLEIIDLALSNLKLVYVNNVIEGGLLRKQLNQQAQAFSYL